MNFHIKLNPLRAFLKSKIQKNFKVIFPFVYFVAVIGLAIVIYRTYNDALTMIKEQFANQQIVVAKQTAVSIEQNVKFLIKELEYLSRSHYIKDFNLPESRRIIKDKFTYLQELDVSDIGLLDARGVIRIAVKAPQLEGANFSFREFFKKVKVLKRSETVFEFVKFKEFDTEQKGITIAMPVFSHTAEFIGAVTFIVKVDELIKGFFPIETSEWQSCVIDSGGNILCDPKKLRSGKITSQEKNIDPAFKRFFDEVKAGKVFKGDYISPDGIRTTAVSYPIKVIDQTWSMIIETPEEVLSNMLKPFSVQFALAALILLIAVALTSFIIIYGINRWNIELDAMVKHRTEELTLSEQKLRGIVETISDVIWEIDSDYQFIYVSPTAERILGYTPDELLGKTIFDVMPDDSITKLKTALQTIADNRQPFTNLERISLHKNGVPIVLETNGAPLLSKQGKLLGFRGADRDITRRKKAEQDLQKYAIELEEARNNLEIKVEQRTKALKKAHAELVRKEKFAVLGELASSVSHELRNPLGVIKNAIYFFTMKLKGYADDAIKENVNIINQEISTANKIISDLLDYTRDRMPIRTDVEINKLVREVLSKSLIPDNISVMTYFAEGISRLSVDPTQVSQILINLVSNAVQSMEDGGTLTVSTRVADHSAEVVFADDGCGIPEQNMDKIFEPLFTTKAKGIGLGLAVSKNMAEANGGTLTFESEEGKGTTFYLRFRELQ